MRVPVGFIIPVFLLTFAAKAFADAAPAKISYPAIVTHASTVEGFVPAGWRLEQKVLGDLNADNITDCVLVVTRNASPTAAAQANNQEEEPFAPKARMLIVALGVPSGFDLALANHTLIPLHDTPTIDDPFDGIAIAKGALQVSIRFFANMGSWTMSTTRFTFRYRDRCFRLVGYDRNETRRNSGETTDTSINYLTRKIKISRGTIEDDTQKTVWRTFAPRRAICLEEMGDGFEFEAESDHSDTIRFNKAH